jgi:oligopeptide/dipeptide ABC transporter ATP-binding protein
MTAAPPLLEVDDLAKAFLLRASVTDRVRRERPRLTAVDGVSFVLERGETLGIVGESGSGKTTVARCLVRLQQPDRGRILLDGEDVLAASGTALQAIRRRMQMVYQDPYSALNPRLAVGDAIAEPARVHGLVPRSGQDGLVGDLLDRVGLARSVAAKRPRELSGGQRQRVSIARALALQPDVIVADEPVSALDVSVQAQILNLLEDLRDELGVATIIIAHQLSVIAHVARRVVVMYLGRVVEEGPTERVFVQPRHPYTAALLAAHPSLEPEAPRRPPLQGDIPSPLAVPSGCRFRTRCPLAQPRCSEIDPPPVALGGGHFASCILVPERGPDDADAARAA